MKDPGKLIHDMLAAISSIESYRIQSYESFLADEKTQDATMYNLIIMGEAANQFSDEFRERCPQIPWESIIGTRNIIVHGYNQVKLEIVWDIISKELHALEAELRKLS